MVILASPIVDWNAMWKICLVALAAGAGVVVVFGFLLLGLRFAHRPATDGADSGGPRLAGYALALVCGGICIGIVVVGVYAMTRKPSSKPAKPKAALVIPTRVARIVSSR